MHKVLVNRLAGLSLLRKSVVKLTDRLDMTLDVYRGRKTTMQQRQTFRYLILTLKLNAKNEKTVQPVFSKDIKDNQNVLA